MTVNTRTIKVCKIGEEAKNISLQDGKVSAADALMAAGYQAQGFEVRVNGRICALTQELSEGDTLLLVPLPDMSTIMVRVGRMPGTIKDVVLNESRCAKDALASAGFDPTGFELRINGEPAKMDHQLEENDTVLLVRPVEGN